MAIDSTALKNKIKDRIALIDAGSGAIDNDAILTAQASSIAEEVNSYGEEIENLGGKYSEFRYQRSPTQPATPVDLVPVGWALIVPAGDDLLWIVSAYKTADGTAFTDGGWSAPSLFTGEQGQAVFKAVVYGRFSEAPVAPV